MNASPKQDAARTIPRGRPPMSRSVVGWLGLLLSALPSVSRGQSATVYLNEPPASRNDLLIVTGANSGARDQQESPFWDPVTGRPTRSEAGNLLDDRALISVLPPVPTTQGTGNQSQVVQLGNGNSASADMLGTGNQTYQYQSGSQNNSTLSIGGDMNVMILDQRGYGNIISYAVGTSGEASPTGVTAVGSLNRLGVVQDGNNNTLSAKVVGSMNDVSYAQYGNNLVGGISIMGNGRTMSITQVPSYGVPPK